MQHEFLEAIVIILGASALSVFVMQRFRVPSTVGFILAGIIIGPHGVGLIKDTHEIEALAEVGVILLLFIVGVEFSLKRLMRIKYAIGVSGGGQVLLTIALTTAATYWFADNLRVAVFYGFITALSSTAIVLKSLTEQGEIDTPQGNLMLGVLIFQDLCIVPLLMITPALGSGQMNVETLVIPLVKAAVLIVVTILSARWLLPSLLHQIVHTRNRELMLIFIVLVCLGIPLLTSSFGLSLALGAFLAGLVVSESEYSHQIIAEVLPLKEIFLGLFFVSIGMLMDLGFVTRSPALVMGAISMLLMLKLAGALLPLMLSSSSFRVSVHATLGLAQIGEFSFILAETGKQVGLMPEGMFQLFLSASIGTMVITPFVLRWAAPISSRLATAMPYMKGFRPLANEGSLVHKDSRPVDHVIIIGFGINGRNLARTLRSAEIPYVVLEMNNATVRAERAKGEPIYFGDATSRDLLMHLGIKEARTLVVAIGAPSATRQIISIARLLNPMLHIIVRTRYNIEVDDLIALGANEVIPEEFETSIELFSRVLGNYRVPANVIESQVYDIRKDAYRSLRAKDTGSVPVASHCNIVDTVDTDSVLITDGSPALGMSIKDTGLRQKTGATIIAIRRQCKLIQNPSPAEQMMKDDVVLLIGDRKQIIDAKAFFREQEA